MTDLTALKELLERAGIGIRPLVWSRHPVRGKQARAAGLGVYRIHETGKYWYLNQDYMGEGGVEAAQDDFDNRILSALIAKEESGA